MDGSATGARQEPWYRVDLEVSSWVEGRGVRHTDWSVRINDAWVPVSKLRDVASTMTDPMACFTDEDVDEMRVLPAGCQYRITYHQRLLRGTRLLRRISVPCSDAEISRRSKGDRGAWKLPIAVTTTEFRVTGPNRYVTEERWAREEAWRGETNRRKPPVRDRQISSKELDEAQERLRQLLPPRTG
jgi:hypothetical protein